ncbi:MAG: SDR family oxidoreductase [Acidobacteriota bacterium]|nr:SDR family oxidoreductase [Acidobacteriota bacterium]
MAESSKRTIFLTGASGVIGRALLEKLEGHPLLCLVRQTPLTHPGLTTLHGDISLPRFGWSSEQWAAVVSRIDCVVHAAAVTDFHLPDAVVMEANVAALENVFELAAAANVPLYHFSTAFVRPPRNRGNGDELAYAVSKREGERLVRESGLPHVILRPSMVIGDSATGEIARFQAFHSVLGGVLNGLLPVFPGSPSAFVDCIPQDVVAETLRALIDSGTTSGEYWLTAGQQALTIARIGELLEQFVAGLGGSFTRPRIVSPDVVERLLLPVFFPALPLSLQKRFEHLLKVSSYLFIDDHFPCSMPELASRLDLPTFPGLEVSVLRSLTHWASVSGFAKRAAA